jgi:hypothetical protein
MQNPAPVDLSDMFGKLKEIQEQANKAQDDEYQKKMDNLFAKVKARYDNVKKQS